MYPYIQCYSCGFCIGNKYDAFKALRAAEVEKKAKSLGRVILPDLMIVTDDLNISLGKVLDDLCIFNTCCRAHIMTQVEFKDIY